MADVVLIIAIASLITIFLILITLLRSKSKPEPAINEEPVRQAVNIAGGPRDQDVARHIRARRAGRRQVRPQQQAVLDEDDDEEDDDPLAEHIDLPEGKIGVKKRKKLEMKAEKRAAREREEEERKEKKEREAMLEERRKKDEAKEKQEVAKQAEEEKLKKEEEERKEHEAYLLLKESFNVEDEGFDEVQTDKESQELLKEFVNYVKNTKVVLMEDLAAKFKLKTQDVIERINSLQTSGQLTGVLDDRGKFIYISRGELEAVAKFIQQRGRVSIAELVESSNTLINLTSVN